MRCRKADILPSTSTDSLAVAASRPSGLRTESPVCPRRFVPRASGAAGSAGSISIRARGAPDEPYAVLEREPMGPSWERWRGLAPSTQSASTFKLAAGSARRRSEKRCGAPRAWLTRERQDTAEVIERGAARVSDGHRTFVHAA